MDFKTFAVVFGTVFLAELGDKTQLATLVFAGKSAGAALLVFIAAAAALVLSTAIAVVAGVAISQVVSERALQLAAGVAFVAIGVWTLARAWAV